MLARGREGLEGAKREVEKLGGRGLILIADVADDKAVEAAAEKLEKEFGPIDIWINDAMASVFSPINEMTPDEFRRVTEVTYLGYVWGTMAALRRMRPRNRGIDRSSRFGAGISRHSAAIGLLRGETRNSKVSRIRCAAN